MLNKYFKVTFLSDIVLNGSSNTEGKIDVLDFITGSSFLGIVAKEYEDYENAFDIFHSGKVRFGEAKPLLNGKISYKIPYSFFKPKIVKSFDEVYNNHLITYTEEILEKQLKQQRSGFITSENKYFTLDYNYEQKSAFDSEKRKSEESSMFGYQSIKKGTTFAFKLSFSEDINEEDKQRVLRLIEGEKNLGKSKQTQYGKVKINQIDSFEEQIEKSIESETTYVYLNSSLALMDENGFPTYELNKENLGLKNASIDFANTQIRTKEITVYNSTRKAYDSSRLVIEKGSVIALKNLLPEDAKTLKKGLGAYLNEGYGEVLINPSFLLKEQFSLDKITYSYEVFENNIDIEPDENLIGFLQNRQKEKEIIKSTSQRVSDFIEKHYSNKFKNVNKSQWGQIRAILQVNNDNYKKEIEEFISKGVSEKQWKESYELIKQTVQNESLEFLKLLCIQMPKKGA